MSEEEIQKSVLGEPLEICSMAPRTGWMRSGACDTGPEDMGSHTVCVLVTDEFLEFSREVGNDLSTPNPDYEFPGLQAGDRWCLSAYRWKQAFEAGVAPRVAMRATNESALEIIEFSDLRAHAIDIS